MDGLAALIILCVFLMFGVPLILILMGLVKLRTNKDSAKKFIIAGVVWLIIGGGVCAMLLNA